MFLVIDQISRNVLGESDSLEAAESVFRDYLEHDARAGAHLQIIRDDGEEAVVVADASGSGVHTAGYGAA